MSDIGGFRREELDPAIAGFVRDEITGEQPMIVLNRDQPRNSAVNVIRAMKTRVGLFIPVVPLLEVMRRPMMVGAATAAAVAGSVVVTAPADKPVPDKIAPVCIIKETEQRMSLTRVRQRSRQAHTAQEKGRAVPAKPTTPQRRPRPTPTVKAQATPRPTPTPSHIEVISPTP